MPRSLVASVLAILLCCHGVVVFAQILVEAGLHRDLVAQTLWSDASVASSDCAADDGVTAVSADDADLGHGIEVAFEGYRLELTSLPAALPAFFSAFSSSTFLEPPTRPPQPFAFLA